MWFLKLLSGQCPGMMRPGISIHKNLMNSIPLGELYGCYMFYFGALDMVDLWP